MTVEKVTSGSHLLALIIRGGQPEGGVKFFTPDDYALQMGKHNHPKGKMIKPHRHMPVKVERTGPLQEVLYIEEGRVKIDFYSHEDKPMESKVLNKGDMILLMEGGHGFEFLEPTKMIEIKQGPYIPESKQPLSTGDR